MSVQLIIGLGNPGEQYTNTRHNAGVWFLDAVARQFGGVLKAEKKFLGAVATVSVAGTSVKLLAPSTYMNDSALLQRHGAPQKGNAPSSAHSNAC